MEVNCYTIPLVLCLLVESITGQPVKFSNTSFIYNDVFHHPIYISELCPLALPIYRPKKIQVARLGESFEFDFGYSSPKPPQSYSWTKNGLPFGGIRSRILLSHEGILFATVLQEDVGDYVVTATNSAGSTSASAVLKGEKKKIKYVFVPWYVRTVQSECSIWGEYISYPTVA